MALGNYVERSAAGSGIAKHAGTRQEGDADLGMFVGKKAVKAVIAAGAAPALATLFHSPGANAAQKEWACKALFMLAHSEKVEKEMWADHGKKTMSYENMEAMRLAHESGGPAAAMKVAERHRDESSKLFFTCIGAGADTFYE